MKQPRRNGWFDAIDVEVTARDGNGVLIIIRRSKEWNLLNSKWVLKEKCTQMAGFIRLKALLVACGNEQAFGVDYLTTFY